MPVDEGAPKCVFFLGAGFTKDAGIPLQSGLLPHYLYGTWLEGKRDVVRFLRDIYSFEYARKHANPDSVKDDKNTYPPLEDIYSAIDKALIEGEYLGDYAPDDLRDVRDYLTYGILKAIDSNIRDYSYVGEFARTLTDWRLQSDMDDPFSIITTNWDIVLLNRFREYHDEIIRSCLDHKAISRLDELYENDRSSIPLVDFCLYTHSIERRRNHVPSLKIKGKGFKNIKLLFLHGSPFWNYCRKCTKIFSPPAFGEGKDYGKQALASLPKGSPCPRCDSTGHSSGRNRKSLTLSPILVMPTYYKMIQNVHLLDVWQNAAMELQEATKLYFVGYSLPSADYLIRNLLTFNLRRDAEIHLVFPNRKSAENYRPLLGKRLNDENVHPKTGKVFIRSLCKSIRTQGDDWLLS